LELVPGLVVVDRFRLLRPLGEGGMGAVWLAQQIALDVPCAVKFIHEDFAAEREVRARFEREAKAAAQLRSPHVVQILDHGMWEGRPYIAMELLDGEDLDHRLARRGRLAPAETLAIAVQVGRALSRAHATGLVHRDLKPANIFLSRDEDREIVKVLDFGIAKQDTSAVDTSTKTGTVLGTPHYMSPEQASGAKDVDHRSDLWALSVVVYQCITGEMPFVGAALGDLFVKIIVGPPPVPSRVADVPPGFDAWWARATRREPGDRFQSAKEFVESLGRALGIGTGETPSFDAFSPSMPPPPAPVGAGSGSYPNLVTGSAPTEMQQSFTIRATPSSRTGRVVASAIAILALAGVAGVAVLARGNFRAQDHATPTTAAPAVQPEPSSPPVATAPSVAPLASSEAREPSPEPSASASATAAAHAPKGRAPARPATRGGSKADPDTSLGF
jgi:serine/threonine-protein kinase